MTPTNSGKGSADRRIRRLPHPDCPDCTLVAVVGDDGTGIVGDGGCVAAGIKLCDWHRQESDAAVARARAANPEIDAMHRMVDAMRARTRRRPS